MSSEASQGCTFAQKALARAASLETTEVGQIVDARPDLAFSHDNSAAIRQIWLRFGRDKVRDPGRMAITLDHAVPAPTTQHALNHAEIRRFVVEQGIESFFEAGDGICHQVLSEEALVLPGQLILGADSHTPHFGWMGAFGAGVGRSEMAAIWATGELWLRVPEAIEIEISGELQPWVSAKDLALEIIGRLGTDGGLYKSVEFTGAGIAKLSLSSRMTLANMMAELGCKCSYLQPDNAVFSYLARSSLRRQNTPNTVPGDEEIKAVAQQMARNALYPDANAPYEERHHFDAGKTESRVACPHTVDNTVAVGELSHVKVDQAFLGTCTNGRLEDIEIVHRILDGRTIAAGTRLLIVPASRRVLRAALRKGWIDDLLAAGAVLGTPGCGPCMGNHQGVLAPGEVCISSANRNFRGRMGTADAEIYLASPAVVAASAVAGRIASPADVLEK
ncbi:MAG: aconitase/3-isopropylmalate dehydratase large subunit family protein [Acidobacteria bacterium]|nr:aconitase/3-isopropylmalate dehydratase large subunit family protein [Acidobacteriota bacterium]